MIRDAKESALRLGVDALDLLYSHGPDPAVPYEDTVGALKTLLDEGVIRFAGISRVDNAQIDTARGILGDRLIAVQNQFSPSHPDPEHTMGHCADLGLDFVCWSPLGGSWTHSTVMRMIRSARSQRPAASRTSVWCSRGS